MLKKATWKWVDDHEAELTGVSDSIWGFAEHGLLEEKSSKLITSTLEKHGFKVKLGVASMPTAIIYTR